MVHRRMSRHQRRNDGRRDSATERGCRSAYAPFVFSTLLSPLPRPDGAEGEDDLVEVAIAAQVDAGLEPVTDGRLRDPAFERLSESLTAPATDADSITVDWWRFASGRTDRAVKQ